MRTATKRLTVELPAKEHLQLKMECTKHQITITDFIKEAVAKGLQELKKKALNEGLDQALEDIKEDRVYYLGDINDYDDHEFSDRVHQACSSESKSSKRKKRQSHSSQSRVKSTKASLGKSKPSVTQQ